MLTTSPASAKLDLSRVTLASLASVDRRAEAEELVARIRAQRQGDSRSVCWPVAWQGPPTPPPPTGTPPNPGAT